MSTGDAPLTIRRSGPGDALALRDLAALDSTVPLGGEVLVAEVDGAPWAAVEVATGRSVADPFRPTAAIVEMLRLRAGRLLAPAPRRGGRSLLRSLLRPA